MTETTPDTSRVRTQLRRLVFMVLFALVFNVAEIVLTVVVVVQFVSMLVTGRPMSRLQPFGQSLMTYVYEIIGFLIYHHEEMPWPFSAWPLGPPGAEGGGTAAGGPQEPPPPPPGRPPGEESDDIGPDE